MSPGNARALGESISEDRWETVSERLNSYVDAADSVRCNKLLLSYELLFASLSVQGRLEKFASVAKHVGANAISCLLFVREPVDHALSLYKHRAKNGLTPDLDIWLERSYSTPRELDGFLSQVRHCEIDCRIRKYEKDPDRMSQRFFGDWLGIEVPPIEFEPIVNASLTLSELQLLRQTASIDRGAIPIVYSQLLSIPVADKAPNSELDAAARDSASMHLSKFPELWAKINRLLKSDGGISLPVEVSVTRKQQPAFCFNGKQLEAWTRGISSASRWRHKLTYWFGRNVRPSLSRLLALFRG